MMSDCEKCWDTPCTCGYEYRNWRVENLEKLIAVLQRVLNERQQAQRAGKDGAGE